MLSYFTYWANMEYQ